MRDDFAKLRERRDLIPRHRDALAQWRRLRRDIVGSLIDRGHAITAKQRAFVAAIRRGERVISPITEELLHAYRLFSILLREVDTIISGLIEK